MADVKRIKHCPFCGEHAVTSKIPENTPEEMALHPDWAWRFPGMWTIGCETEACYGNAHHFAMLFQSEELAIETWNRRKETPFESVEFTLEVEPIPGMEGITWLDRFSKEE